MSILQCPIQGTAAIKADYNDDGTVQRLEWVQVDLETHIDRGLLDNMEPQAEKFLKARYVLGEECPYDHRMIHARLRNGTTT